MYDSLTIVGNLGRDPEMRYTPSGMAVTNFSVAVNRNRKGEKSTMWIRVSCFGKLAENANQYLKKGKTVLVEGQLQFDEATGSPKMFKKQNGEVGVSFEMITNNIKFIGPADHTESDSEPHYENVDTPTEGEFIFG